MPSFGVSVAIIQSGKVLLTLRDDFQVWCLPGGAVDAGESVAEAVVREVREEIGLNVRPIHLVGIYSRPDFPPGGGHEILFTAIPIGGAVQLKEGETVDACYFDPRELPANLVWWHRRQIQHAFGGVVGVVCRQNAAWPLEGYSTRQDLYDRLARDVNARERFQLHLITPPGQNAEVIEVEGS